MKILLTGGSGMVGSFLTPYLKDIHELKIFDLREPKYDDVEFVQGSMDNPIDVTEALKGVDLFINLTMKNPQGGSETTQNLEDIQNNYDLNTKGLHTFLYLAQKQLFFLLFGKKLTNNNQYRNQYRKNNHKCLYPKS